ncbi:MAG: hypothetical protein WCA46_20975, partial [Actinocatenispora sp.]
MGIWARCLARPLDELPDHGWKLHVSGRPADLPDILAELAEEYLLRPFSFKCVRATEIAVAQLSRWWPRGVAGKAVAVYPESTDDARELAERLTRRLARFEGPHILTDRRWRGSNTVQYRYGTFRRPVGVDADGHPESAVTGPDGSPWSDDRTPRFTLPPWLSEDPFGHDEPGSSEFLQRYRPRSVLRHSTAGGVYLATGPDGTEVVLKEARPHTAFAPDGSDAVQRLHRERDFLDRLKPTGIAPQALEIAEVWEHTFLAQTKVPGITFQRWLAKYHPFAQGIDDPGHLASYRERVDHLIDQLRAAVLTCLEHGVVYGDMSLTNLLVDETDTLRLIDFEGCRPGGTDPADYPRTTGFSAADGSRAGQSDEDALRFAVRTVEAACVVPRNALIVLDTAAYGRTLRHNAALLERPVQALVTELAEGAPGIDGPDDPARSPAEVAADVARQIRSAATPHRPDRLFPGHPEMFRTNPLSVAYGAAGVLRALKLLDGRVDEEHVGWLLGRLDTAPLPHGLYLGTAGIGVSLIELGETGRGTDLLRDASRHAGTAGAPAGVA